jgi:DNA-binding IclR family transcriptional regulator
VTASAPGVGRSGIAAVERAVRLLEAVGGSQAPQTMQGLAEVLDCSPSTVHRIVVTLHRAELLQFDPVTKSYSLGVGVARLAHQRSAHVDLAAVARPLMERLRERVHETVSLWIRSGGAKVCVAVAEGSQEIRQVVGVGTQATLELSAGSRVLMADHSPGEVRDWARAALGRRDRATEAAIAADVAAVRAAGVVAVADDDAARLAGDVGTLAAPVFDERGAVVAALVAAGPAVRFDAARMQAAAAPLRRCAEEITAAIGGKSDSLLL